MTDELTPELTLTSESRAPSDGDPQAFQQQQRDLALLKASADAYEAQQAIYAAENAARWELLMCALRGCDTVMREREDAYQNAMRG